MITILEWIGVAFAAFLLATLIAVVIGIGVLIWRSWP